MMRPELPTELIEAFVENRGVFFVGAGLSIAAGYPSWPTLIDELILVGTKSGRISADKESEYNVLKKDTNKFLMLAEELKFDLGSIFTKYMEEKFQNGINEPSKDHQYIVQTKGSLIITINYDDLLEQSYNRFTGRFPNVFIYSQSREAANNFWKDRFFILKAHGDARRDVETLILSQRDYRRTLYKEAGYRSLLQTIFTTKSILFVGVSMNDPEFNQLLDYLHDSYHGGGPTHYLIIEKQNHLTPVSRLSRGFQY